MAVKDYFQTNRAVIPEAAQRLSGTFRRPSAIKIPDRAARVRNDARLWNLSGRRAFLKTPPENAGIGREDRR